MALSLHDVTVTNFLQILNAVDGFLAKGRTHFEENGVDLQEVVDTRIHPDMNAFQFQVVSVAHHSMGAVKGAVAGEFAPPAGYGEPDYAGLQTLVKTSIESLNGFDAETVDALQGNKMVFKLGGNELPFTVENFLMSFSIPNLNFHATTAYDILRMKGVPVGKRDYLGAIRVGA